MMRAVVKETLSNLVYRCGLLPVLGRREPSIPSALVLMYHRVAPDDMAGLDAWQRERSLPGIVVTPEVFDAQLAFLAKQYTPISIRQLTSHLESDAPLPPRSVVITFDDGWRDNYVYAYPLLRKHRIPATIFLATDYVGTSKRFWPESLIASFATLARTRTGLASTAFADAPADVAALLECASVAGGARREQLLERVIEAMKHLPPATRTAVMRTVEEASASDAAPPVERTLLSWEEVLEMQSGGVDFGSHCSTHELMPLLQPAAQRDELVLSKTVLEGRLGRAVDTVAYPNGALNDDVKRIAAAAGYRWGFSVQRGRVSRRSDPLALERINIHQGCTTGVSGSFSPALFASHIEGLWA
jgi:peptidoglycan/xylan/chitin deacetylase (PgdA/CDA1 family)